MAEQRRSLTEGLKATPPTADAGKEKAFVYGQPDAPKTNGATVVVNRVPISTRIRDDYAKALKRASLERQLEGREPNTLQDLLEEAIEPWLKSNGYLS